MAPFELEAAAPLPPVLAERGFKFCHAIRVRYRDIDAQGIVFNGNYMAFIDYGVTEYFRHLGFPWREMEKHGFDMAVVRAVQDFRSSAQLDDVLFIGVRVTRIGNSSFQADVHIVREDGAVVVEAQMVYVNYDPRLRRARPVPPVIRAAMAALEGPIPGAEGGSQG